MKLLFALALSALLLYGCAQRTIPSACQGVAQERLANCVYVNSVLEQNPYYCYSLQDLVQRKTCMHDATEPSMKKALERASAEERDSIFGPAKPVVQSPPVNATPPQEPEQLPVQPAGPCDVKVGKDKDSCIKASAVAALDISACTGVFDPSVHQSCISDIARKTKNISSCALLLTTDDVNLCKLYARGDESK